MSRATSRRISKAMTRVVDTAESGDLYQLETPEAVEEAFEHMWRNHPREKVKVVDMRPVEDRQEEVRTE